MAPWHHDGQDLQRDAFSLHHALDAGHRMVKGRHATTVAAGLVGQPRVLSARVFLDGARFGLDFVSMRNEAS
ncbi:MAG: hypothetical protein M3406_02000 [Chloroflexota bacterium]|nr:hypothetical protein [Chloroflexota bacterium]